MYYDYHTAASMHDHANSMHTSPPNATRTIEFYSVSGSIAPLLPWHYSWPGNAAPEARCNQRVLPLRESPCI